MDQALMYYVEAMQYIADYSEITAEEYIFESEEVIKEKEVKNESVLKNAIASMKKMIDKLIQMMKDIIAEFKDFFAKSLLTSEEKARYAEFKAFVKSHPELGKRKVDIEDWRAYEIAYDEAMKRLEEEAKKENPSVDVMNSIVDSIKSTIETKVDKGKTIVKRAIIVSTLDAAIDAADSNVTVAKGLNWALQNELVELDGLSKDLGGKDISKFENKIDKYAKNSLFHRMKVKLLRKKQRTLSGVMKRQMNRIMSFTDVEGFRKGENATPVTAGSVIKGVSKNKKFTTKVLGGPGETLRTAKDLIGVAVDSHRSKKRVKKAKKEFTDFKKFLKG